MAVSPSGAIGAPLQGGIERKQGQWKQAAYGLLLLAGLYAIWGLDWQLYRDTWQARSYVSTEAQIIAISLDDATMLPNGDGPMRGIVVEYRYALDGQAFTGNAATLRDWEPLDGRRLRALYRDLAYARLVGRPVTVFVDPYAPGEALLDRSLPEKPSRLAIALAVWCLVVGGMGLAGLARGRD